MCVFVSGMMRQRAESALIGVLSTGNQHPLAHLHDRISYSSIEADNETKVPELVESTTSSTVASSSTTLAPASPIMSPRHSPQESDDTSVTSLLVSMGIEASSAAPVTEVRPTALPLASPASFDDFQPIAFVPIDLNGDNDDSDEEVIFDVEAFRSNLMPSMASASDLPASVIAAAEFPHLALPAVNPTKDLFTPRRRRDCLNLFDEQVNSSSSIPTAVSTTSVLATSLSVFTATSTLPPTPSSGSTVASSTTLRPQSAATKPSSDEQSPFLYSLVGPQLAEFVESSAMTDDDEAFWTEVKSLLQR